MIYTSSFDDTDAFTASDFIETAESPKTPFRPLLALAPFPSAHPPLPSFPSLSPLILSTVHNTSSFRRPSRPFSLVIPSRRKDRRGEFENVLQMASLGEVDGEVKCIAQAGWRDLQISKGAYGIREQGNWLTCATSLRKARKQSGRTGWEVIDLRRIMESMVVSPSPGGNLRTLSEWYAICMAAWALCINRMDWRH